MDLDTWLTFYWVAVVVILVGSFVLGMASYDWIIDVLARHIPRANRWRSTVKKSAANRGRSHRSVEFSKAPRS